MRKKETVMGVGGFLIANIQFTAELKKTEMEKLNKIIREIFQACMDIDGFVDYRVWLDKKSHYLEREKKMKCVVKYERYNDWDCRPHWEDMFQEFPSIEEADEWIEKYKKNYPDQSYEMFFPFDELEEEKE